MQNGSIGDIVSGNQQRFGVTIQNAVPVTPPPPLGVITGFSSLGFEYEDSSGAAHVAINTGICKIL
jgi:hypothetical protein